MDTTWTVTAHPLVCLHEDSLVEVTWQPLFCLMRIKFRWRSAKLWFSSSIPMNSHRVIPLISFSTRLWYKCENTPRDAFTYSATQLICFLQSKKTKTGLCISPQSRQIGLSFMTTLHQMIEMTGASYNSNKTFRALYRDWKVDGRSIHPSIQEPENIFNLENLFEPLQQCF